MIAMFWQGLRWHLTRCSRALRWEIREKLATHIAIFWSYWKDADPDLPILQQAKAEYAKLQ